MNAAFAAETCRLFADVAASLPEVNLHGDAHVEQFAVTSLGSGLTDFDDCTRGDAVIDLVRFGTSLLLDGPREGLGEGGGALRGRLSEGLPLGPSRRGLDALAGPGHEDQGRLQVGPRAHAAPGRRPHRQGSPPAGRVRGRGPAVRRARPVRPGPARVVLRGQTDRVGHHGDRQRARREVPDHLRGRHPRRGGRPGGGGEADPGPERQPLPAHGRGRVAHPGRPAIDRLRAFCLRGGGPSRDEVLLDARLDGRLPGGAHRLGHPLASRPARGGARRRAADGPRAPQAAGRGAGQEPAERRTSTRSSRSRRACAPQFDRWRGRRRPRGWPSSRRRRGGSSEAGGGGAGGDRERGSGGTAFFGALRERTRRERTGTDRNGTDWNGTERTDGQVRGVLRTPRCVTKPRPSRGRRRRGRRRGP